MKRANDIVLSNHFYPNIKTLNDCIEFLNYSAYDSITSLPSGSHASSVFCFLAYLCGYSSLSELQFMLGPYFSGFSPYVARIVGRGLADKYSLPITDFGSYVGYRVTDDGFAAFLSGISDSLKEGGGVRQKRRTATPKSGRGKGKTADVSGSGGEKGEKRSSAKKSSSLPLVPMHDYGLGISILSLLSIRRGISISKEAVIHSGAAVGTSGKLRVDAVVGVESDNSLSRRSVIYLEQDMGTESARQLLNKLYVYGDARILNPSRDCILLSCHAPSGSAEGARFDARSMEQLCSVVAASGEDDVYAYYLSHGKTLSATERIPIESLLLCVGAADRRKRTAAGLFDRVPDVSFTVKDLSEYVQGLRDGNNPYYERHVNARLTMISKKTLRSVCDGLDSLMFQKGNAGSFLALTLLRGYGVYVLPSTLLANSSHLYLRADGGARLDRYINSIAGYYPNFGSEYGFISSQPQENDGDDGFSKLLRVGLPGGTKNLRVAFSNTFFSMAGDLVCFEHLGRDAGAFVRLLALARATNREELNLHVIAICDSIEDADFFCRRVAPVPFIKGRNGEKGFRFTFLFEHTVRGDGCSPMFEFNKPYSSVSPYLELSYNSPVRPKKVNATNFEVFGYSIGSFA